MLHRVDEQGFLICSYTESYPYFQQDWILISEPITQSFIKAKWNGSQWIEGTTTEEIAEERNKKAVEIDLEYTERIAKLMAKHNDKFIEGLTNGVPYTIPQDVLIEKQRLKDECNQLIADLGVTDYSYRQNNLQLKK